MDIDFRRAHGLQDTMGGAGRRLTLKEEIIHLREELARLEGQALSALQHSSATPPMADLGADSRSDTGPQQEPKSGLLSRLRRHPWRLLGSLALLACLIMGAKWGWTYLSSYESTDDAQIDGHINAVSSRISGTISEVLVDNTDRVKAGQELAEIDPRDYQVVVDKARADLAQAEAGVGSARREAEVARAKVRQAEAVSIKAQHDAQRYQVLFQSGISSRQEYEDKTSSASVDAAAVDEAHATVASADKTIGSHQAAVAAAKAALAQALLNLSYTRILAPVDGVVGKKTVEVGHRVDPGEELMAVVPLDDIWVTANFKETQLRRIHPGQRVTIHVDALGRDFPGVVEGLGGASGEKYSLLPPENATGNYVKVVQRFPLRIRFTLAQDNQQLLRPGMSVEPSVWIQ